MFGISHKLNDSSLYLLYDMVEGQLKNAELALENCEPSETERISEIKQQIDYYKYELKQFEEEISKQRSEKFQFSVEELYSMYGQFERRFLAIEFHKHSEAANKFERNIGGVIIYSKKEREELEKVLNSGDIPRTNGIVKFDVTSNYDITKKQHDELLNVGFLSGDIYQISASNFPVEKSFLKEGIKEIPGTINIKFDPTGMDPNKVALWLFTQRINDNGKLTEDEWNKLCGYSLYYQPESINLDFINQRVFDKDGNKITKVRFYELNAKIFNNDINEEDIQEFSHLLKNRTEERLELIESEIKKSTNKSLKDFANEYREIYDSILVSAVSFEDDTIEYLRTITPIYWDFKAFLHIYLRHCPELQIEGNFENKTKFQYNKKDIRRVLEIAIRKLSDKINDRLSDGKDFRVYGDKALYFNGNYYSLRIENTGRIDSFYPQDSK